MTKYYYYSVIHNVRNTPDGGLEVDVSAGSLIDRAIDEGLDLANGSGQYVEFNFNGIVVHIEPGMAFREIIDNFWKAMNGTYKKPSGITVRKLSFT